jgi:hypothetical protein
MCCLLAMLASCGGNNTTIVVVSPSSATVAVGGTLQFTANVPVTWSVAGNGVINTAGFFTASNTVGTATVTAIATDGSRATGSATVTITKTGATTTTTTSATSGISHRVFVSNKYFGVLNIINADTDQISNSSISVGGTPTFMSQTADQAYEVVYDSTNNILALVTNSAEAVSVKTSLAGTGTIKSTAVIPGATAVYAAVPTASAIDSSGAAVTGAVYRVDLSTTGGILSVGVSGANSIAMDHNAVNLLAFGQDCDTVTVVTSSAGALTSNTGTLQGTVLPNGTTSCGTTSSFSRPVAAVFSSDDKTAYVLSSGAVNGGTQAMVTVLDMTQSPPAITQSVNVSGANVGLLQGTQLYVAGAIIQACGSGSGQCQKGVLSIIDTSTSPISVTGSVQFGPEAPVASNITPKVLTFDGTNLWMGSTGCPLLAGAPGCLSLYFPGNAAGSQILTNSLAATLSNPSNPTADDITGMVWLKPFNGRSVMYVIEGAELNVYNSSGSPVNTGTNLDIVGQAVDIKIAK